MTVSKRGKLGEKRVHPGERLSDVEASRDRVVENARMMGGPSTLARAGSQNSRVSPKDAMHELQWWTTRCKIPMRRPDDKYFPSLFAESGPDVPVSPSRTTGSRRMLKAAVAVVLVGRLGCSAKVEHTSTDV